MDAKIYAWGSVGAFGNDSALSNFLRSYIVKSTCKWFDFSFR